VFSILVQGLTIGKLAALQKSNVFRKG